MEKRPVFTVIAGPNGAGKSRLCPFYVSIKSFDGDKLALNLRKEHPDWPEHWISGTVASELEKQKNHALEQKKDFAFETNFSNEMVVNMIEEFKNSGYKVSLCYFGLYSEDESVSRVILRSQTGGHDVSDEVIRFNFTEGLKNAKEHLDLFENITFVDGNSDFGRIVALHIGKNGKHEVTNDPPLWFKEHFLKPFEALVATI
ncbi:MAG: zeta toxin family protein [Bacteroidales bacterium]|nr:zeta toxin family protein [Bacteroidales bacterium]